ncbi:MAG: HlyD family secretion protein [Deltaproteobacteria bacterium]
MIKRILPLLLLCAALIAGLLYSQRRTGPLKVSGFIESDEIRVGSRVGGRVQKILVQEGDEVHKGQPLVELEPFNLQEQRSQAAGVLAQAQADYERLQAGYQREEIEQSKARLDQLIAARDRLAEGEEDIAAAEANLQLAQAQFELSQLTYSRTEALFAKKNASQSDMDQAASELRVARASVRVREEELAKLTRTRPIDIREAEAKREEARQEWLLRDHGYRKEEKARAKAAVEAAQAALEAIDRQLEELTVRAPAEGVIDAVDLRPGDLVGANAAAITMIEKGRMWVRAYVPENHLDIGTDQQVAVTVDSLPKARFKARVIFVSRQAEFTPGNVQTPEERSKQVFRIKVLLEEGLDVLRAGMTADVWFDVK